MSNFVDIETSYEDGRPVELFDIVYSGNEWHYTNDVEQIVLESKTYVPIPIHRGETSENGDAEKANLEVRISRRTNIVDVFKITPPSEPVSLTIRQFHKGAAIIDPSLQTSLIWKGRITNVAWVEDEMVLSSESFFSSLLRVGVTRKYSRQCTHTLFGGMCQLKAENYKTVATPSAISGTKITVPHGKPDRYFAGGFVTYRNSVTGATERRAIRDSDGLSITVSAHPLGLVANFSEMTMYAGCDHIHATCKNKFNNIINYGGQPYIPILNPFGGSSIY